MTLLELTGVKKHLNSNDDAYLQNRAIRDIMQSKGFELIGKGLYGYVYDLSNKMVLKIFEQRDTKYQKYINYCKENSHNPHLPKFKGKTIRLNTKLSAVRLEKLSKPSTSYAFEDVFEYATEIYKSLHNPHWEDVLSALEDSESHKYPAEFEVFNKYPDFWNTLTDLWEKFDKEYLDIHYENIMMRRNVPVIIDI